MGREGERELSIYLPGCFSDNTDGERESGGMLGAGKGPGGGDVVDCCFLGRPPPSALLPYSLPGSG